MSFIDTFFYIYGMAKSKIEALIKFASSGAGNVVGAAKSIGGAVNSASGKFEKMQKQINSIARGVSFQSTVTAIQGIAGAFKTVAGVASSAFDFINNKANEADRIGKFSRLVGMSAENLQRFRSAGQDAGMSLEGVDAALQKFSINTGKAAKGEKTYLDVFNALGVRTRDTNGDIREQSDLLLDVADAYAKLTNEADKNNISQILFGRSGVQMSELLGGGSENLKKQFEQFDLRGSGITSEMAAQGEAFNNSIQFAGEALTSIVNGLTKGLIPAGTAFANKITNFVVENRKGIDAITSKVGGSLVGLVNSIGDKLPAIFDVVVGVAGTVSSIIDKVIPFVPEIAAITAGVGGLLTAVAAVKAAVIGISFVVGGVAGPIVAITAGVAGIAYGVYQIYKNWDMIKSALFDLVDPIEDVFTKGVLGGITKGIRLALKSIPGIGKLAFSDVDFSQVDAELGNDSVSEFARSISNQTTPQDAQNVVKQVQESRSTTTNRLSVDFSNVPRGAVIQPDQEFNFDVVDVSAGYAFAP